MNKTLNYDDSIAADVDRYLSMLLRLSFTYMKNIRDAEDLAQEAFLKLIEKKPSFQDEEHKKAWLIRVSINLCKNRLKTAWFRRTLPLDEAAFDLTHEENEVLSTVMELPAKYRSIILLFYFEEYSIGEIAGILGQKESTVGSQLHRARKLLKSKLKEGFDGE